MIQEATFIIQLLETMIESNENEQTSIYSDNQGRIYLAKNSVYHYLSKHVVAKQQIMKPEILNGTIEMDYIPSHQIVTDLYTKTIDRLKLNTF